MHLPDYLSFRITPSLCEDGPSPSEASPAWPTSPPVPPFTPTTGAALTASSSRGERQIPGGGSTEGVVNSSFRSRFLSSWSAKSREKDELPGAFKGTMSSGLAVWRSGCSNKSGERDGYLLVDLKTVVGEYGGMLFGAWWLRGGYGKGSYQEQEEVGGVGAGGRERCLTTLRELVVMTGEAWRSAPTAAWWHDHVTVPREDGIVLFNGVVRIFP